MPFAHSILLPSSGAYTHMSEQDAITLIQRHYDSEPLESSAPTLLDELTAMLGQSKTNSTPLYTKFTEAYWLLSVPMVAMVALALYRTQTGYKVSSAMREVDFPHMFFK